MLLFALVALAVFVAISAPRREVFRQHYTFTPGTRQRQLRLSRMLSTVRAQPHCQSRTFALLQISGTIGPIFNFTLVNETTGTARDFGREISHYSDEGSPNDSVVLPNVPAGKYYLRVEPEMQSGNSVAPDYEL